MPCFTRREVPVEVTVAFKADNKSILIAGLTAAGFTVTRLSDKRISAVLSPATRGAIIDIEKGQVTVNEGQTYLVNEIKRAYSVEVVKTAAKRFGWSLTNKDANTMLAKRRF